MRLAVLAIAVSLAAGGAQAQVMAGSAPVVAVINRMTDAVNKGEMATAFAAFTASPWIVEDGAPYHWQGPGAPQAWIAAMGANADAHGMTAIDMKLSAPSRVEVSGDQAYAVVPGRLSYTMKDGHSEHADGILTFTLAQSAAGWKIDSLVWSGPQAKR
jgi:ketosteroid isomerase-like protein